MTDITRLPQVGLLIHSHRGVVEVEVYADPQDAQTAYHRWWAEQSIDPGDIDDVKGHEGQAYWIRRWRGKSGTRAHIRDCRGSGIQKAKSGRRLDKNGRTRISYRCI